MGTVNVVLGEDTRLNLILGQQLENAVTSVVFDFSAWQTTYGAGTLALSVQRPGDDQPYAVALTTSGTDATWSVTNLDTAYKGVGHIQLTYTVGSAIKKSVVYKFTVYESLGANGEYPSPGQTWQEEMEQEITDVKSDLSDVKKLESNILTAEWELGSIDTTTGADVSNNARTRTIGFIDISEYENITFSIATGYKYWWDLYSSNGTLVKSKGSWATTELTIDSDYIGSATKMRVVVSNTSDTTASPTYGQYLSMKAQSILVNIIYDIISTADTEVSELKEEISDIKNLNEFTLLNDIGWANKTVNGDNGAEFASTTRILSDLIDLRECSSITLSIDSGYKYTVVQYDVNKAWVTSGTWGTTTQTIVPPSPYIKVVVAKSNDATISLSDGVAFHAFGSFAINDFVNGVSRSYNELDFNVPIMRNGSIGNIGNVNGITTEYVIPIPKRYDFVMVEWTGYDITENEDVGFGYCVYDGASDGMTSRAAFDSSAVTKHNYNSGLTELTNTPPIKYISLDDLRAEGQHYGICVVRKRNGSYVPLRIATAQYSLKLTYGYYENNKIDTSILSLNPDIQDRLLQANRPLNTSANAYLSVAKPVTLLHFSDIHGDVTELKRMVDLRVSFSSMIDDAICTGDMVDQRYSNGMSWWTSVSGSENILMAIGNHDALSDPTGYDWTQLATQEQQYSQYFSPYISNWGVTYTTNKTYYYKDYSAKKIRLVVLNCMLTGSDDTDQQTWLTSTLASAKTAGLSVVIAVHYMPYNPQKIGCNFSSLDKGVGSDVLALAYLTIVQNFIDAGGEFICYIAGHVHYDIFVKSASYPNQMCICIDALNVYQSNVYSDTQRTNGTKSQDLANLITFDTASKAVKISRVGADQDHYLRSKKFMTFKYLTGDIITEN